MTTPRDRHQRCCTHDGDREGSSRCSSERGQISLKKTDHLPVEVTGRTGARNKGSPRRIRPGIGRKLDKGRPIMKQNAGHCSIRARGGPHDRHHHHAPRHPGRRNLDPRETARRRLHRHHRGARGAPTAPQRARSSRPSWSLGRQHLTPPRRHVRRRRPVTRSSWTRMFSSMPIKPVRPSTRAQGPRSAA